MQRPNEWIDHHDDSEGIEANIKSSIILEYFLEKEPQAIIEIVDKMKAGRLYGRDFAILNQIRDRALACISKEG